MTFANFVSIVVKDMSGPFDFAGVTVVVITIATEVTKTALATKVTKVTKKTGHKEFDFSLCSHFVLFVSFVADSSSWASWFVIRGLRGCN